MDGDVLMVNGGISMVALRSADAVAAPGRIVVCPIGQVKRRDGTDFVMDADSVRQIQADLVERGTDVVIDMDHQTLGGQYARPDGAAPAMGWINSVHFEPNVGLVGHVEWTNTGAAYVARKEYRYLSPVLVCRKGQAIQLHSVALTNAPMISNAKPIVNSAGVFGGVPIADSGRAAIINSAGREWDSHKTLQGLTSRSAYCADALRQQGLALPDVTEWAACSARHHRPGGVSRASVIANAAREFDSHPALKKITSRAAYINGGLRDAGLCQLANAYTYASDGTPMSSNEREKTIRMFADRWSRDRDLQEEIDVAQYVDECLEANLLPRMTAEERDDLRGSRALL